jgi:hypothetical protein
MATSGVPPISHDSGPSGWISGATVSTEGGWPSLFTSGGLPESFVLEQFDLGREKLAMAFGNLLVGAVIAATGTLAACNMVPPPKTATEIDSQYGIPPGSVPAYLLRPDGLMINGLLPAQPYDTGG